MAFVPEKGVTATIGSVETGPITLEPGVNCEQFAMIGSQVIPGAAHEGSDIDIAVFVEGKQGQALFDAIMIDLDGEANGSAGESEDGMESFKVRDENGKTWNYLLFTDREYFLRFVDATTICRQFGVIDKGMRVAVFALLTDGIRKVDGGYWSGDSDLDYVKIYRPVEPECPFQSSSDQESF